MPLVLLFLVLLFFLLSSIATATTSSIITTTHTSRLPLSPPAAAAAAIDLGTTLIAIAFDQGVVVGADTRTSVGGAYVSHRSTPNKIEVLDQRVVLARSGSAATTQHLAQAARRHIQTHVYNNNNNNSSKRAAALTIKQMAHWLQNRVYRLPPSPNEVASLILAGCDTAVDDTNNSNNNEQTKNNVRPNIYVILPSGACWREDRFAVAGSGSSYILGFLDHHLQQQQQQQRSVSGSSSSISSIQQDEAIALCRQALSLAMARDGSSGGMCRIFVVTAQGCQEMTFPPTVTDANQKDHPAEAAKFLKGFAPASATTTNKL